MISKSDGDELTDDALTGGFRLYQRRRGHRYSLDDVLTAYQALQVCPRPRRCLDLGCGIGSVLLMVAYKCPEAELVGIEAQSQSFALAERNVRRNGVDGRVRLLAGDLRDPSRVAAAAPPFDLVTGTPPYQPKGMGTPSPDSQRAHARVELRGGVECYLKAAAAAVADDGYVVVCADARHPERVWAGASEAGLHPVAELQAVPSVRKGALFTVWVLQRRPSQEFRRLPDFVARDRAGQRTAAYQDVRAFFDFEPPTAEAPSPPQRVRQGQGGPASHGERAAEGSQHEQ